MITPGPWKYQPTEPPGQFVIHSTTAFGPGRQQLRTVAHCTNEDNARLIVSAERLTAINADLVAALSDCVEDVEAAVHALGQPPSDQLQARLVAAWAALARARTP